MVEVLPEIEDQPVLAIVKNVLHTGEAFRGFEVPVSLVEDDKKKEHYFNLSYTPLKEEEQVSGVLHVAIDVTEQVKARRHIEGIIEERTIELAEANRLLEQNNRELQQFAYIASHDLQEPIRKVATFTQMLERNLGDIADERSKNFLQKIASSSRRMMSLIHDLLAFSQVSTEGGKFEQVNLRDVMQEVTNDFELLIEERQATVRYTSLPVIEAIPLHMNQLFNNLVSNALKFSRKDVAPEIEITATVLSAGEVAAYATLNKALTYYRIRFSDNGIGFEKKYAEKIFDIFQRLHSKVEYEGTGIGLAICKKIALYHNGDLTATSVLNQGATFDIVLPKRQPEG